LFHFDYKCSCTSAQKPLFYEDMCRQKEIHSNVAEDLNFIRKRNEGNLIFYVEYNDEKLDIDEKRSKDIKEVKGV
jgi:hypothetical protein